MRVKGKRREAVEGSGSDINLVLEEVKSLRRATAVLNLNTEGKREKDETQEGSQGKRSLKRYLLEKMQVWINSLLEAERDEFLGRGRHAP
jgi:hypothetical protein